MNVENEQICSEQGAGCSEAGELSGITNKKITIVYRVQHDVLGTVFIPDLVMDFQYDSTFLIQVSSDTSSSIRVLWV